MPSNLDRYRKDLTSLTNKGLALEWLLQSECFPAEFDKALNRERKKSFEEMKDKFGSFDKAYQGWYSEAKALVRQLLPDRLEDFVRHYEKPKGRKSIDYESYRIEDGLQSLRITKDWGQATVVNKSAAIPHLRQQRAILESAIQRFESSLFDIRQLAQADLFDSELDAARELARKKFYRASGAVAGVVLEGHLAQICENHKIPISKKSPSISDLNDALKQGGVFDTPLWRQIQHLGDIRNLCDHRKETEPNSDQIEDLISGVAKLIKTTF